MLVHQRVSIAIFQQWDMIPQLHSDLLFPQLVMTDAAKWLLQQRYEDFEEAHSLTNRSTGSSEIPLLQWMQIREENPELSHLFPSFPIFSRIVQDPTCLGRKPVSSTGLILDPSHGDDPMGFSLKGCLWRSPIGQNMAVCQNPRYPCSSHQYSWDLWMFIPLKMDDYRYWPIPICQNCCQGSCIVWASRRKALDT